MKRWLIVMGLLVVGLLMVGWGGDALAAILSIFTPNKPAVTQTIESSPSVTAEQPVEATPAVYSVQAMEPGPGTEPVHPTREKKADRLRPMQPVQSAQNVKTAESLRAKPAAEKKTWTLASVEARPAALQAVTAAAPIRTGTVLLAAEPAQAKPAIEKAQPIATKPKPGKAQPADIAQPVPATRPVQVAILGAPNLKAALPAETSPEAQPAYEPRPPTARPEAKSACNSGPRVVSAYYWEGRRTASGEPFNPRGMTAAHRTLPFGTHLNVTNPRTGKTVNVVVNDRGPFVHGVSLDLSLGAAQAIGLQGTGAVCVL
jgi:rare lipoprotein A